MHLKLVLNSLLGIVEIIMVKLECRNETDKKTGL